MTHGLLRRRASSEVRVKSTGSGRHKTHRDKLAVSSPNMYLFRPINPALGDSFFWNSRPDDWEVEFISFTRLNIFHSSSLDKSCPASRRNNNFYFRGGLCHEHEIIKYWAETTRSKWNPFCAFFGFQTCYSSDGTLFSAEHCCSAAVCDFTSSNNFPYFSLVSRRSIILHHRADPLHGSCFLKAGETERLKRFSPSLLCIRLERCSNAVLDAEEFHHSTVEQRRIFSEKHRESSRRPRAQFVCKITIALQIPLKPSKPSAEIDAQKRWKEKSLIGRQSTT